MKILKKTIALFLVVALFAALSMNAFAVTDSDSGVMYNRKWNASYTISGGGRASGSLSWYGSGTVAIQTSTHQKITNTGAVQRTIIRNGIASGSVSVSATPDAGCYFNEGSMLAFVRNNYVSSLDVTYKK